MKEKMYRIINSVLFSFLYRHQVLWHWLTSDQKLLSSNHRKQKEEEEEEELEQQVEL